MANQVIPEAAANTPMTITQFLEARISEDEMTANDLKGEREGGHVLAECAARRAIIAEFGRDLMADVLGRLATVYADHPDYQQEWAL